MGGHPGSPESRSTLTAILKEGILVSIPRRQGAFPIPESGRPPPLSHLLSHRPDSQATWDWATLGKAGEGLCAGQDGPPTETQTGGNQEPGSRPLFARISRGPSLLATNSLRPRRPGFQPLLHRTQESGPPATLSQTLASSPQRSSPFDLGVWLPSPSYPFPASGVPGWEEVQGGTPPRSPRSQRENPWPPRRPGIPSGMTVGKGMAGVPREEQGGLFWAAGGGGKGGNQSG